MTNPSFDFSSACAFNDTLLQVPPSTWAFCEKVWFFGLPLNRPHLSFWVTYCCCATISSGQKCLASVPKKQSLLCVSLTSLSACTHGLQTTAIWNPSVNASPWSPVGFADSSAEYRVWPLLFPEHLFHSSRLYHTVLTSTQSSYLQPQIQFLERSLYFIGEGVHALTFLEGNNNVRRPLLHLCHQFCNVKLIHQFL